MASDLNKANMRLAAYQIEAIKQESEQYSSATRHTLGFTTVELITAILILGILAVVAAPRFFDRNTYDSRGLYDQVISTLRYAQKVAIAQHRFVCAAATANSITLTINPAPICPGGNLVSPSGGMTYVVTAPSGVTISPAPATFYFDALGKPSAAQDFMVSGYATHIIVEAETGYVH